MAADLEDAVRGRAVRRLPKLTALLAGATTGLAAGLTLPDPDGPLALLRGEQLLYAGAASGVSWLASATRRDAVGRYLDPVCAVAAHYAGYLVSAGITSSPRVAEYVDGLGVALGRIL